MEPDVSETSQRHQLPIGVEESLFEPDDSSTRRRSSPFVDLGGGTACAFKLRRAVRFVKLNGATARKPPSGHPRCAARGLGGA